MNILLTGASGFIGRHILKALENQNHNITACCRNSQRLYFKKQNTHILSLDFNRMTNVKDWIVHLEDIDIVINCVGIIVENKQQSFKTLHALAPIALFKAAEQTNVKKVIQISALGADDSAISEYHLSKKKADDMLRSSTLDWTILQPSIVYGEGAQSMTLFHALAAMPVVALIDGGNQLLQPVHVSDIADTVIQCLEQQTQIHQTLPLVGPEPISFRQFLAALRQRMGKKTAYELNLPGWVAERSAVVGKFLGEPTFRPSYLIAA